MFIASCLTIYNLCLTQLYENESHFIPHTFYEADRKKSGKLFGVSKGLSKTAQLQDKPVVYANIVVICSLSRNFLIFTCVSIIYVSRSSANAVMKLRFHQKPWTRLIVKLLNNKSVKKMQETCDLTELEELYEQLIKQTRGNISYLNHISLVFLRHRRLKIAQSS